MICMIFRLCMVCRKPSFGAIMQTMQIMQIVQTMQGIETMQTMQNVQTMQGIETMQTMQVMQKRRKLRSKGRAGPYGRPVVGWRRKQPSPSAAPVFPSQSRRPAGVSPAPPRGEPSVPPSNPAYSV